MGKCYCEYCDVFLTNDSVAVRKQHNDGNRHKFNVCEYYRQYVGHQLQEQIDEIVAQFEIAVARGIIRPSYGLPPPAVKSNNNNNKAQPKKNETTTPAPDDDTDKKKQPAAPPVTNGTDSSPPPQSPSQSKADPNQLHQSSNDPATTAKKENEDANVPPSSANDVSATAATPDPSSPRTKPTSPILSYTDQPKDHTDETAAAPTPNIDQRIATNDTNSKRDDLPHG